MTQLGPGARTRHRSAGRCPQSRVSVLVFLVLAAGVCLLATGCSRQYWRNQADRLTYDIIRSKSLDPRWISPKIEVRPIDPRSRFANLFDPDKPPLPPDDPEAHGYMHYVYGMKGYKNWHKFGDTFAVENPCWLEPYGLSPEVVENNLGVPALLPEIRELSLEESIQLSYIHSRDFQLQLENIYLFALSLTIERFAFDVQFYGLSNRPPSSDLNFESQPGVQDSMNWNNRVGVNRYFPTGAQFLAELTNNTLWIFGTGDSSTATNISYSLIQPLLASGGRRFALESLTQSERNVLYAIRNFSRFRMSFFANVVAGLGLTAQNFPGVTASGATGTNFTSNATGATVATLAGSPGGGGGTNVGGYLGIVQLKQQILNQEDNIRRTEEQLRVLRAKASQRPVEFTEPLAALPPGIEWPAMVEGQIAYDADRQLLIWRGEMDDNEMEALLKASNDPAYRQAIQSIADRDNRETITNDVAQLDTQLAALKIALYNLEVTLQNSLDNFKILLGLPTDMPITIDQSLLKPFELIDLRLARLQDKLTAFVASWAQINEEELDMAALRRVVLELSSLREALVRDGFDLVERDLERVQQNLTKRLEHLDTDEERARVQRGVERDQQLLSDTRHDFGGVVERLGEVQRLLVPADVPAEVRQDALRTIAELREDLLRISQGLSVLQIDLRLELIDIPRFDITMEQATALGLANRPDLMNARAQVMDARRKMEVAANQLQATLNLVAKGDVRTQGLAAGNLNPFDFRGDQSDFQAGVSFTSPIQLVQQRNNYRAAQIFYEQARRNYMLTEDQVKFQVRTNWREVMLFRRNLELARYQVRIAAVQYDQAQELTVAPVQVGQAGRPPGLTLLQALSSLLSAQNNLINIWIQYESNRLTVYRDMGIMEIDEQGFWKDEFYQERLRAAQAAGTLLAPPPEVLPDSAPSVQESVDGSRPAFPSGSRPAQAGAARVSDVPTLPAEHPASEPIDFPARSPTGRASLHNHSESSGPESSGPEPNAPEPSAPETGRPKSKWKDQQAAAARRLFWPGRRGGRTGELQRQAVVAGRD